MAVVDLEDDVLEEPAEAEPLPWERQTGETPQAYHAFCHYRDQKVRNVSAAYREHKLQCDGVPMADNTPHTKRWQIWTKQWNWASRIRAYDADIEKQVRERLVKAQADARERHARLMQATLTTLTMPVKAALDASQDKAWLQRLAETAKTDPMQFIRDIARIASTFPAVVTVERLALGMSTEHVEVEDRRDDLDAVLAQRIVEDPAATELAIQLLSHVAGAGQGPAIGAGGVSEPGQVVSDAASELPDETAG